MVPASLLGAVFCSFEVSPARPVTDPEPCVPFRFDETEQRPLRSRSDILPGGSFGVSRGLLFPDPTGLVTEIRHEADTMRVRLLR